MRWMVSVQIRILHQCPQHIPARRMDECNIQPVLQLERNDFLFDQRSDHFCLMPINNVVPGLVTLAIISMEPHGQLVLGVQLNGYNNEVRTVRLNEPHPSPVKPSWYGDSVGHYEGDTLVIDTVGVKTDRKYAMIDLFGTPYTDKLHVVERYRLRDYDDVKDALDRHSKENWLVQGDVWTRHRGGKFLQAHVTV